MRTIKFRGKRITDNQWVYGGIAISPVGEVIILTKEEQIVWNVIPETVGQFTGLTDKNGVEIYEGDIIRSPRYWSNDQYWETEDFTYYYIKWLQPEIDGFYGFHEIQCNLNEMDLEFEEKGLITTRVGCDMCVNTHHYEVCGNIHDNPELL